jgi:hypothetical protein
MGKMRETTKVEVYLIFTTKQESIGATIDYPGRVLYKEKMPTSNHGTIKRAKQKEKSNSSF